MICVTFDFFFGCPPEQRPPVRIQLIQISQISDSFTRRLPLQHKQQILRNAMSSSPCRTGPSFDLEIFGKRSLPASIAHGTTAQQTVDGRTVHVFEEIEFAPRGN